MTKVLGRDKLKSMTNPFRQNSKLSRVFEALREFHFSRTLAGLTDAAYPDISLAGDNPILRRRTASAVRTIRSRPGINVVFDNGFYEMVPTR
jgi:hypothetical protein